MVELIGILRLRLLLNSSLTLLISGQASRYENMREGTKQSSMNLNLIYLDKLVGLPHFPRLEGSLDATSKVILPDLKRTGIRSVYSKSWSPPAIDVSGKISSNYKSGSTDKIRLMRGASTEAVSTENFFNLPHRRHLNDQLIQIDRKRDLCLSKTRNLLAEESKMFGFQSIKSESLCLSGNMIAGRSQQLMKTAHSPQKQKKHMHSRMRLFESMIDDKNRLNSLDGSCEDVPQRSPVT